MKNIFQIFYQLSGTAPEKETVNQQKVYVATCALLLEMAHIDGEFNAEERENIIKLMRSTYQLPEDYIHEIADRAQGELASSNDLWQFTDLINRNYSLQEKTKIIELVWEIIYSDGRLDRHEDYLVHKLARLLNVRHSELIEAKLRVLYKE